MYHTAYPYIIPILQIRTLKLGSKLTQNDTAKKYWSWESDLPRSSFQTFPPKKRAKKKNE